MRTILIAALLTVALAGTSLAAEKSFYSPVIHVDVENHRILISQLGGVF